MVIKWWTVDYRYNIKTNSIPDSKFHGANTGPIWGQQDPGGSRVGPMNFPIWDAKNPGCISIDIFAMDIVYIYVVKMIYVAKTKKCANHFRAEFHVSMGFYLKRI